MGEKYMPKLELGETYDVPILDMFEISPAVTGGIKARSKSLDDLSDFGALTFHVELYKPSWKRDSLWKYDFRDLKHSYKEKSNRVWLNGDAKLLKSKWEEMEQNAARRILDEEIDFVKDIVEKGRACNYCSSSEKTEDCDIFSSPGKTEDCDISSSSSEEDCECLYMTAKAVAELTMYGLASVDLSAFEHRLSSLNYEEVRMFLFIHVALAVLSIFDMENFRIIYNREEMEEDTGLSSESHESFSAGKVKNDDVYTILLRDEHWVEASDSQISTAMMAINNYTPLKEYYKEELSLELIRRKCFHVFDTLVIKALKGICSQSSLFGYVAHKEEYFRGEKEFAFKHFVQGVVNGLHRLGSVKSLMERERLDGQTCDEESSGVAGAAELMAGWQNPVWKKMEKIWGSLGWSDSGEAKLLCSGEKFVELLSEYQERAPQMFRTRRYAW